MTVLRFIEQGWILHPSSNDHRWTPRWMSRGPACRPPRKRAWGRSGVCRSLRGQGFPPQVMRSSGTNEHPPARSRRVIWLAAVLAVAAAILGIVVSRRGTTSQSVAATATASAMPLPVTPPTETSASASSIAAMDAAMDPAPSAASTLPEPSATARAAARAATVVKPASKPAASTKKPAPRPADTFSQD